MHGTYVSVSLFLSVATVNRTDMDYLAALFAIAIIDCFPIVLKLFLLIYIFIDFGHFF